LLSAAPFSRQFTFTQPNGAQIELLAWGDEFSGIFETSSGYTVVFDAESKTYFYAQLSPDGAALISSGEAVDAGAPQTLGLTPHLRLPQERLRQQITERYQQWDASLQVSKRWNALKQSQSQRELGGLQGISPAPPARTTLGTKVGLCLIVDFDDDPATVPQGIISEFFNGDAFTNSCNNGSVRSYFQDNSGGRLVYSNVVTVYVRIPSSLHPKSFYDDQTKNCGSQGALLLLDALAILKALPNYTNEILPTFNSLTVNVNNEVVATSILYAGWSSGFAWAMGLWPHSGSLGSQGAAQELSPGGKKVVNYLLANIGYCPDLGMVCHETGHLLCGYPDLYDYQNDSRGGAGFFCLMDGGNFGCNPVQICAYLKTASGWATITDLDSSSVLTGVVTAAPGTNFNHFYRYRKPGVSTEYFLVENRQRDGRDGNLPGSGIAIWHVDELGDHNNQSLLSNSTHSNYEVTLVQADNQWHFESNLNGGEPDDLYYKGNPSDSYSNCFSDASAPNAHWWGGGHSGLNFHDFSFSGPTMTFLVGFPAPVFLGIEAESGVLTSPMTTAADANASAGYCIYSATANQGLASYTFSVPQAGNYVIWCRVLATNWDADSCSVSMDGGTELVYDAAENIQSSTWQWTRVIGRLESQGVNLNPRIFNLTTGSHTLAIRGREAHLKLDRFIITSDTHFVPAISLEAESAVVVSPMAVGADPNASHGQYVSSPMAEQGTVSFEFATAATNQYQVWCRVYASLANADSFYVSVDGGPELIYDIAEGSWTNAWQWTPLIGRTNGAPVNSTPRVFSFGQEKHTIIFRAREAGARLDRLLLTYDTAYNPNLKSSATISRIGSDQVQMSYTGVFAQTYLIQAATNLTSPIQWTTVATNLEDWSGRFIFSEPLSAPVRFYRIFEP
jgi:M6 family metalloprotease-like protein